MRTQSTCEAFSLPSPSRRVQMARFVLTFALFATLLQPVRSEDWQVIRAENRDYVSFANVAQFYRFPQFTQVNETVSLRDGPRGLRAEGGTNELYLNGVRFFTDFPLLIRGTDNLVSAVDVAKIIEPVLRPNKISGGEPIETVVLDPGHGGVDSGTSGLRGSEKTFALDVALTARENLLRAGFKVEMTRTGDREVSLEQRVAFANQFTNAVFVSIHFNSALAGSGVESYALAPAGVPSNASTESHRSATDTQWYAGNAQDPANIALAAAVHASILSRVSVFDRGVRHARFHVLREARIPAVLVEAGFLNDRVEGARIATPQYRQLLGQAIAQAVTNYNKAVNFSNNGTMLAAAASNLPPHTESITESLGAAPARPQPVPQEPSAVIGSAQP